jgi:hypothetical protein
MVNVVVREWSICLCLVLLQAPPKHLVERYLVEIAKSYNVAYLSPPESAADGDAIDLLAIDPPWNGGNNFKPGGGGSGGGHVVPAKPFQYPVQSTPVRCGISFQ